MVLDLPENNVMKFTEKQTERYSRQIILKKIGAVGQKKLLGSNVLIVGAGGLGSPIAIACSNALRSRAPGVDGPSGHVAVIHTPSLTAYGAGFLWRRRIQVSSRHRPQVGSG